MIITYTLNSQYYKWSNSEYFSRHVDNVQLVFNGWGFYQSGTRSQTCNTHKGSGLDPSTWTDGGGGSTVTLRTTISLWETVVFPTSVLTFQFFKQGPELDF